MIYPACGEEFFSEEIQDCSDREPGVSGNKAIFRGHNIFGTINDDFWVYLLDFQTDTFSPEYISVIF
jgi:hypothetical protein